MKKPEIEYLQANSTNMWDRNNNKIEYIVLHYVGAVSTAKNNAEYLHRDSNLGWSAHFFVDEHSIFQSVPLDKSAGHCGVDYSGGKSPYWGKCKNKNSIGIEMCCKIDSKGNWFIEPETVSKTLELVTWLMSVFGIDVDHVLRHYDVCWKTCPEPWVRNIGEWYDFIGRVKRRMNKPMEEWKVKAIEDAMKLGISDGTNPDNTCTRVEVMAMTSRAVEAAIKVMAEAINEALKEV